MTAMMMMIPIYIYKDFKAFFIKEKALCMYKQR